jgi:hypothetical protein
VVRVKWALRLTILFIARQLGLFELARRATARELRILCYHGVGLDDEGPFRPVLFINGATLASAV